MPTHQHNFQVFMPKWPLCLCALFMPWGCHYSFTDHFFKIRSLCWRVSQSVSTSLTEGRCVWHMTVLERYPWKHTPTISGENKIVTRLSCSCHCTEICYFHKTLESQSCKNMKDEIVIRNRNLFFTSTQNHGKTSPPIHALNCLQSSGVDEILYFCIRLGRGNFRVGSCRHLLSLNVAPQRIWKKERTLTLWERNQNQRQE